MSEQMTHGASRGGSCSRVLTLAASLLAVGSAALCPTASAADRHFAVIVGFNGSDDAALAELSYADDDALRYGALFEHLAEQAVVLTTPDSDTRRLMPRAVYAAPTRAGVLDALTRTRDAMAQARAAGDRPVLLFIYSGHGNYDAEGRGYVNLDGGRFTTRDVFFHVLEPAQGDPVILIIDACNAALMVHSRGGSSESELPERRPARPTTLDLSLHPNAGLILASSAVGETHEWGRYLAGIFSHQIRSALVGPADLNGDRRVTFSELASFIAAANERVANPTARITPYIRPPIDAPDLALSVVDEARFGAIVRLDSTFSGHAHVVDEQLIRYADFHAPGDRSVDLALTGDGPWHIVTGDRQMYVPQGSRGVVEAATLAWGSSSGIKARGPTSEYFDRTLFGEPHDQAFHDSYLTGPYLDTLAIHWRQRRAWYDNAGAWAASGVGLGLLAAGIGTQFGAMAADDRAATALWAEDRRAAHDDAVGLETAAWTMVGVGAAALAGGVAWFVLDRPVIDAAWTPPLGVRVGPAGAVIEATF